MIDPSIHPYILSIIQYYRTHAFVFFLSFEPGNHDVIDHLDNPIAGLDVLGGNLGQHATPLSWSSLVFVPISALGPARLIVHHGNQFLAAQVVKGQGGSLVDVVLQDIDDLLRGQLVRANAFDNVDARVNARVEFNVHGYGFLVQRCKGIVRGGK
eukprot:CAMPEP_0168240962 /NCGR_PEP_ID=MMETSP0140_2-20121125/22523_1 /TAXON_ID=44445 /ORGANISM="Pseudo-nitzschia australis, Strain 10249 10 AB" /LENGTH=154 /DNA_ID=CAMNT_0008175745 /DNA_START=467 /DNA_END=931 /DNA_ORIENTATION=+